MSAALAEPAARKCDPSHSAADANEREHAVGLADGVLYGLVGEPFRHVRVSYGGELQLHFGELRQPKSAKLKGKLLYGSYILGLRASAWILSPGSADFTLTDGQLQPAGTPIEAGEVESGHAIPPGALVVSAGAFHVEPVDGIGLRVLLSDGSKLVVLPSRSDGAEGDTPVADWELFSPKGFVLQVGPGTLAVRKPS